MNNLFKAYQQSVLHPSFSIFPYLLTNLTIDFYFRPTASKPPFQVNEESGRIISNRGLGVSHLWPFDSDGAWHDPRHWTTHGVCEFVGCKIPKQKIETDKLSILSNLSWQDIASLLFLSIYRFTWFLGGKVVDWLDSEKVTKESSGGVLVAS